MVVQQSETLAAGETACVQQYDWQPPHHYTSVSTGPPAQSEQI